MFSVAHAQTPAGLSPDMYGQIMAFLPLILILAVFYFLVLRPQGQRQKEHTSMMDNIRRGDRVLTTGGLHGTIHKVDEKTLELEVSEGVIVTLEKMSIVRVLIKASDMPKSKAKKSKDKPKKATKK